MKGPIAQTGERERCTSIQLLCFPTVSAVWPASSSSSPLHLPLRVRYIAPSKCELKEVFLSAGGFCQMFCYSDEKYQSAVPCRCPIATGFYPGSSLGTAHLQYLFPVDAVWAECERCGLQAAGKPPMLRPFPGVICWELRSMVVPFNSLWTEDSLMEAGRAIILDNFSFPSLQPGGLTRWEHLDLKDGGRTTVRVA